MSELGITGKRVRKKPKYLRDDEEEPEPTPKVKKQKNKRKSKKESKKEKEELQKPGIKLKIKLGGKSSSNSHASSVADFDASPKDSLADGSDELDVEGEAIIPHHVMDIEQTLDVYEESDVEDYEEFEMEMSQSGEGAILPAAADDDTSDEEREWLDAVESGNIEEYEKQKLEENKPVLTARQRRRLHGGEEEQFYELPNKNWGKPVTKEQLDVRKQKAVQRRQLAKEKSEKAKRQTVDRLLNKSEAAIAKSKGASKSAGSKLPHIRYHMTKDSITLSLPADIEFPLAAQVARSAPKSTRCTVSGCKNLRKYNCSKTNVALCSLQCYKKNLVLSAS